MTTKNHHLDPNVKRDWRVLNKDDVTLIRHWFNSPTLRYSCPFYYYRYSKGKRICKALFPEVQCNCGNTHPCSILCVSDVKKVARQAIKEWEKTNELR